MKILLNGRGGCVGGVRMLTTEVWRDGGRMAGERGMAMMAVIVMFVLIGAAVVSMTALFATEVRRTRAAAGGAQLRQLLLAGTVVAEEELRMHGGAERDVAVKVPVEGGGLRLHVVAEGTGASVRVEASLREARGLEVVRFGRGADGAWVVVGAVLRE